MTPFKLKRPSSPSGTRLYSRRVEEQVTQLENMSRLKRFFCRSSPS